MVLQRCAAQEPQHVWFGPRAYRADKGRFRPLENEIEEIAGPGHQELVDHDEGHMSEVEGQEDPKKHHVGRQGTVNQRESRCEEVQEDADRVGEDVVKTRLCHDSEKSGRVVGDGRLTGGAASAVDEEGEEEIGVGRLRLDGDRVRSLVQKIAIGAHSESGEASGLEVIEWEILVDDRLRASRRGGRGWPDLAVGGGNRDGDGEERTEDAHRGGGVLMSTRHCDKASRGIVRLWAYRGLSKWWYRGTRCGDEKVWWSGGGRERF